MPSHDFTLEPDDIERLANLTGPFDAHLRQIELRLGVEIANRGNIFRVTGEDAHALALTEKVLRELYAEAGGEAFDGHAINLRLSGLIGDAPDAARVPHGDYIPQDIAVRVKRGTLRGRGANQKKYLHAIATHDINFGIGPAGTGKTFLAVAMAVDALNESRVQRLILVRPAVEAGEKLGFLPGDLTQKVDPYLRPLYDALYEMLGVEKVVKLLEKNVIEIAPLAYMRGRTLNDAFVILDEAQNTTIEQMKMFLTRLGFGSTAVVTGDMTQIDLPKHVKSGLKDAIEVLRGVDGVSFTFFESRDVVRHPLVARIVNAYESRDARDEATRPRCERLDWPISRPPDRPRNMDMRLDLLSMLALSTLSIGLLAGAPESAARESRAKAKRPLIVQSHIAAPRSIGAFRLAETTYHPEQKAAGAMFRYIAVPEPALSADVFVYPAGRQPQTEAIKRGMTDFHDSLKAAMEAGFFRNLTISNESIFPLSPDATSTKPEDALAAVVTAAEPVGRRIDMTLEVGEANTPLRSRGYLFYKNLYFYKVRVSTPIAAMDASEFDEFSDHAARTLASHIHTVNIGGCGDDPVYVDKKANDDAAILALVTQVAQRNQENCRSQIDDSERAKLSKGAEIVTIEYSPDEWGGQ